MGMGTSAFILVGIPSASMQSFWLLELHMEKVPKYDTLNRKKKRLTSEINPHVLFMIQEPTAENRRAMG